MPQRLAVMDIAAGQQGRQRFRPPGRATGIRPGEAEHRDRTTAFRPERVDQKILMPATGGPAQHLAVGRGTGAAGATIEPGDLHQNFPYLR